MWPLLLRPPVRRSGSSSDFSGSPFVTSAKSETERNRVPGVIGRNCRMPMSALEHGDRVAFFECDDRLLPRRATARPARRETAGTAPGAHHQGARSEERRVGKECRARGWPDYEKKHNSVRARTSQYTQSLCILC